MIFTEDQTVVPKESAWFGAEVVEENSWLSQRPFSLFRTEKTIVPMRQQRIYTEDWIGLKELDERSAIVFDSCKGEHMHMGDCWKPIVEKFTGGLD